MLSEARALAFGVIVLVPFPFTNQAASKQRPAVIVSSGAYNLERPDVVMMAVTSQLRPFQAFGEVWLDDWRSAGLLKPSAVKPILATLEQVMIIRRLGALVELDRERLRSAIGQIIG
jgi:mRNA interferase MazF